MRHVQLLNEQVIKDHLNNLEAFEPMPDEVNCPYGAVIIHKDDDNHVLLIPFEESMSPSRKAYKLTSNLMVDEDDIAVRIQSPNFLAELLKDGMAIHYNDISHKEEYCACCGDQFTHELVFTALN